MKGTPTDHKNTEVMLTFEQPKLQQQDCISHPQQAICYLKNTCLDIQSTALPGGPLKKP